MYVCTWVFAEIFRLCEWIILCVDSRQSITAADTNVNHEPDAFEAPYPTTIHAVYVVGVFDVVLGGVGNQKLRNRSCFQRREAVVITPNSVHSHELFGRCGAR